MIGDCERAGVLLVVNHSPALERQDLQAKELLDGGESASR